jgi:hypothetical protein
MMLYCHRNVPAAILLGATQGVQNLGAAIGV